MITHYFQASGLLRRATLALLVASSDHHLGAQSIYEPYTFSTSAGYAGFGHSDGVGPAAEFFIPAGLARDRQGNTYVADSRNHAIRRLSMDGTVTTIAGDTSNLDDHGNPLGGYRDGPANSAQFAFPIGVAVDSQGTLYVVDAQLIRKISTAGAVSTLAGDTSTNTFEGAVGGYADGTGSAAKFQDPAGIVVDDDGNVYVADSGNNTIRKITPVGVVTTLAGQAKFDANGEAIGGSSDGAGNMARFNSPSALAIDQSRNLFVADSDNHLIRKVSPAGLVTTIAGGARIPGKVDGPAALARFNTPIGISIDDSGNLYIADSGNLTIRKLSSDGVVSTIAGSAGLAGNADGIGSAARFSNPWGIAVGSAGELLVSDSGLNSIRYITAGGVVTTLAGRSSSVGSEDGIGTRARLNGPYAGAVGPDRNLYFTDAHSNTIRKMTPNGTVTTLAGNPGVIGSDDGSGNTAKFRAPLGIAVNSAGLVFVADSHNHTIRQVTVGGVVTTFAGRAGIAGLVNGPGDTARFNNPIGLAFDDSGNLYVADFDSNVIRKVTTNAVVSTYAGLPGAAGLGSADGTTDKARFNHPAGLAMDGARNLYVADQGNNTIRKISAAGVVTTLAGRPGPTGVGHADGPGSVAQFYFPAGIAIDSLGFLFVADSRNQSIRKITPSGAVTTIGGNPRIPDASGSPAGAFQDGNGINAFFNSPFGIAVERSGTVLVMDYNNNLIRTGTTGTMAMGLRLASPAIDSKVGTFGFEIVGPSGSVAVVESSMDFTSWKPEFTNAVGGRINIQSPKPGEDSHRYYRGRSP